MRVGWLAPLARGVCLLALFVPCFAVEQTVFPPQGQWRFRFENEARRDSIAHSGEELVDEQNWSSQQLGLMSMISVEGPPERIVLEYELEDLVHREQDQGGELEWSMALGRDKTEMWLGSRLWENPLGEISADPFDDFVAKSRAVFHRDGSVFLEDGRPRPAQYFLASGDIGQQVFGGLKVEQWAHRLVVPVPVGLKKQGSLSRLVRGSVQRSESMPQPLEHWSMKEFSRGWRVKMKREDLLPSTSIEGLGHRVEHWRFTRRLEAWLDGETFLPIEISLVEEGSYVEKVALGREQGLDSILKIAHRWRNQFKAVRDEG